MSMVLHVGGIQFLYLQTPLDVKVEVIISPLPSYSFNSCSQHLGWLVG